MLVNTNLTWVAVQLYMSRKCTLIEHSHHNYIFIIISITDFLCGYINCNVFQYPTQLCLFTLTWVKDLFTLFTSVVEMLCQLKLVYNAMNAYSMQAAVATEVREHVYMDDKCGCIAYIWSIYMCLYNLADVMKYYAQRHKLDSCIPILQPSFI